MIYLNLFKHHHYFLIKRNRNGRILQIQKAITIKIVQVQKVTNDINSEVTNLKKETCSRSVKTQIVNQNEYDDSNLFETETEIRRKGRPTLHEITSSLGSNNLL